MVPAAPQCYRSFMRKSPQTRFLLALAALLPSSVPHRDRMAYAGLALWLLPLTVHALQAH